MKTLIIGGGLSGLAIAEQLEAEGQDYLLLEARARFGGRIMTEQLGAGYFDMGPAWFWPGQPRIASLLDRLGLQKFDQYATGDLVFEDEQGHVQRGAGFASMQGSWRLEGGLAKLTEALADQVPPARKRLNTRVTAVVRDGARCTAKLVDGSTQTADQIVLAMPPRIAAQLTFEPALPTAAIRAMQSVSTWMAGQAKAVAVYDTPFWRDAGLSGDAMSRRGPMVEIHDASPASSGPFALFGFIGVPPKARSDEQLLRLAIEAQLVRLFGSDAAEPKALYVKDWAFDPLTATDADLAPQYAHPHYGLPSALMGLWDEKLIFAGTEVAPQFGGYLEGALEAAEAARQHLKTAEAVGL
ncbi:MAG: NAD(P)/FAD-dependent oxidoreductase [Pseudomonadota bacterium]